MKHKNTNIQTLTRLFDIFCSIPDDDIKYIEKLCQNIKFKYCRVFMIHNLETNYSKKSFMLIYF